MSYPWPILEDLGNVETLRGTDIVEAMAHPDTVPPYVVRLLAKELCRRRQWEQRAVARERNPDRELLAHLASRLYPYTASLAVSISDAKVILERIDDDYTRSRATPKDIP